MSFFRNPIVIALVGAVLFGLSLSLRVHAIAPLTSPEEELKAPEASLRERTEARALQQLFKNLSLEAKAVVVWDAKNDQVLFEKNSSAQLPLASLAKVMLAYAADRVLQDDDIITVTGKDLSEEGSSGITAGERFRYADLRAATLVSSLNDGANAISRTMGETIKREEKPPRQKYAAVEIMNASARTLGLHQTYFYNEDGLDLGAGQPGAVGSAKDVARLFSALLLERPKTLLPTAEEGYELRSRFGNTYQYWNTNQYVKDIPGVVGSKTGYTALADGNLAVGFVREGRTIVVVILGSSKEGRFSDVRTVVNFLHSHPIPRATDASDILESAL